MNNSHDLPLLTIGQVSRRCGVKPSTLHFYEDKGLIKSWRNSGNQRRYKKDVLRRVSLIKAGQKVGVDLKSIKVALDTLPNSRTPDKSDWEVMSSAWKNQLDEKFGI